MQPLEGFQTPTPSMPNIPTELINQVQPCNVLKTLITSITSQIDKATADKTLAPGQIELMKITRSSIEKQMAATNCS